MRLITIAFSLLLASCAVNPVDVSPSSSIASNACHPTDYTAFITENPSIMDVRSAAAYLNSIQALQSKRDAVQKGLPANVRTDKVVRSVLDLMVTRKSESANTIRLKRSPIDTSRNAEIVKANNAATPSKLHASDFEALYRKLISPNGAAVSSRTISYESAYFKGQFVDRFGTSLPKPTLALTVTDQEIAAVLMAFIESLADDLFSTTPVWIDDNGNYYPGDNLNKPTFLMFPGAPDPVNLVDSGCGMTKLKIDALVYLSGKASTWAAGETGFVLGSFGGVSGGPVFVLGKLSIGDNKTLQTVAQTILADAAKRATLEGLKDVLLNIDQPADWKLGDLIDSLVFGKGQ
jgi:hypothetical protein